jgi:hypothetical protein
MKTFRNGEFIVVNEKGKGLKQFPEGKFSWHDAATNIAILEVSLLFVGSAICRRRGISRARMPCFLCNRNLYVET